MKLKFKNLHYIIARFPEYRQVIVEMYRESNTFRSLCDDYSECMRILDHLNTSKGLIKNQQDKEYLELAGELEQEILTYINKS
jgi:hypothetical protein